MFFYDNSHGTVNPLDSGILSVINMQGEKMLSHKVVEKNDLLNLENFGFRKGAYVLVLEKEDGIYYSEKIIKE